MFILTIAVCCQDYSPPKKGCGRVALALCWLVNQPVVVAWTSIVS